MTKKEYHQWRRYFSSGKNKPLWPNGVENFERLSRFAFLIGYDAIDDGVRLRTMDVVHHASWRASWERRFWDEWQTAV